MSDDTGSSHDNLISANTVQNNPFDCGITVASHIVIFGPQQPFRGIYHNTILGNTSSANGLVSGEGAGVGLFAAAPGAQNWGNVVDGNTITGNALPGVAMHSHSPLQNLNDNLIVGNQISGNGPDSDPGTTVPTGIDVFADEVSGASPSPVRSSRKTSSRAKASTSPWPPVAESRRASTASSAQWAWPILVPARWTRR